MPRPLTIGLIKNKLTERNLLAEADLHEVQAGDVVELGPFRVEFVHVCHSIPDACLLAVHTPLGTIVHTGDFKLDPTPVDGYLTDYETLAAWGRTACSASSPTAFTSRRRAIRPPSRRWAGPSTALVANAPGRVIIATFASLISRVQQIFDIALQVNRKVALLGRSLENNVHVAVELGYLNTPRDCWWRWPTPPSCTTTRCWLSAPARRASQSALADRQRRQPLLDRQGGRHLYPLGHAHTGQRDERRPRDQQPLRQGRGRHLQFDSPGTRVGPRQPGRAQADAQPPAPEIRRAHPRRDAAHLRLLEACPVDGHPQRHIFLVDNGLVVELNQETPRSRAGCPRATSSWTA